MRTDVVLRLFVLAIIGMIVTASLVEAADSVASLQASFKARYGQLAEQKRIGKIGETAEGTVAAVKDEFLKDKKVKAVLEAENADRSSLYKLLAAKEKITAGAVAKRNAARNAQKATAGAYLRDAKGNWRQKGK